MPKKILFMDEEIFVTAMTRAVEQRNSGFVNNHMPRLDGLIERLNETMQHLTELQYRAGQVRNTDKAGVRLRVG